MKLGLTGWVLIGMGLGVAVGLACHQAVPDQAGREAIAGGFAVVTTLFLRAIKMLIAPLVFSTLLVGVAKMGDGAAIGRIAAKAMLWFIVASVASMGVGLLVVQALKPGIGLDLAAQSGEAGLKASPVSVTDLVTHMVPSSIVDAMANNAVLQIVVFALVAGVALAHLGERGAELLRLADAVSALMLRMTRYVMALAPVAVFAALAQSLTEHGVAIVGVYAAYVGGYYGALAVLWTLLLVAGAAVLGIGPQWRLLKAIREPMLIAFSTTSSEAAFPSLLARLEAQGVPNRIASFVLPLGYSFNLDGAMCYAVFASLFIAQAYGVHLSQAEIVQLLLLLFITGKGIASVPRGSLVVVAATLPLVRLPEAGVALILAVDHFLDMGRTATNTMGNAIAASVVAKWEGARPAVSDAPETSDSVQA